MTATTLLILLLLFRVKHLPGDFIWQTGWMVHNKGSYGHPGGTAHAGLHALLTIAVVIRTPTAVLAVLAVAGAEFVLHYHIDRTRDRLLNRWDQTPQQMGYWALTGLDKFAHQLT